MVTALQPRTFSDVLDRYASLYKNAVVLVGDTINEYQLAPFQRAHPAQLYNFGYGYRSVIGAASGFAVQGKIPFICLNASVLTGECFSLIRNLLVHPHHNVVFLSYGSGFSSGEYGVMRQSFEDIAIMRSLPHMQLFTPGDLFEINECLGKSVEYHGPSYIRLPHFSLSHLPVKRHEYQSSVLIGDGRDVGMISHGSMTHHCVAALECLREKSMYGRVLHINSLSDCDYEAVRTLAQDCKLLVVVEDHVRHGALSTIIDNFLSDDYPRDFFSMSLDDTFILSDRVNSLLNQYGFDAIGIARQIRNWWTELGYY